MAELIQKKLQGEVEKYQQLQKGKESGVGMTSRQFPQNPSLYPNNVFCPTPGPSLRLLPLLCILPIPCPVCPPLPASLAPPSLQDCGGRVAHEMSLNKPFHPPDLSKSMSGRQKLEAQLTENNIVKEVRDLRFVGQGGTCPGSDSDHVFPTPPSGTGPAGWVQRGV